MHALGPRAVATILLAPFAILALDWSLREAPHSCGGDTDAWLAGLAPAAFATGCICLVVLVRISAFQRGGRAGRPTLAATAVWLALAITWWIWGSSSPVFLWAGISYLLLVPAVPAVAGLIIVILWRPSWRVVAGLAWLSAIVLVPGFVVVIEMWGGVDFNC